MIAQNIYTPSFKQKNFFSIEKPDVSIVSVNGYPLQEINKSNLVALPTSHSEYLLTKNKDSINQSSNSFVLLQEIAFELWKEEMLDSKISHSNSLFTNLLEKPLKELKNKIYNTYKKHQEENWDGYSAEPIKYLNESLQFAEDLFSESRTLIESVDIIPENDGCLCFEWFKSDSKYMAISVKDNKLIYTYKLGDIEKCGETTFSGKKDLIEELKKYYLIYDF